MKKFTFSSFLKTKSTKKIIGTFLCCVFFGVGGSSVFAQNNLHIKLPYDPYNNPAIWAVLQHKPLDSLLWQKYVHKQWTEMPLKERLQVKLWIQEMWLNSLNENTDEFIASTKKIEKKNNATINEKVDNRKTDTKYVATSQVTKSDKTVVIKKNETPTTTIISQRGESSETLMTSTKSLSQSQKMSELLAKSEVKDFLKDLEDSFLAESTEMEELKENLYENFFILESVLADEFEALEVNYVFYKQKYPKGNYSESRWMMEREQELKRLKIQKLEEMKQAFLERQIN
jgi:hypothetical protein